MGLSKRPTRPKPKGDIKSFLIVLALFAMFVAIGLAIMFWMSEQVNPSQPDGIQAVKAARDVEKAKAKQERRLWEFW